MIYAICWPEHQHRAQEELDRVVGSDRLVTLSDKTYLPYMNAFVNVSFIKNLVIECVLGNSTTVQHCGVSFSVHSIINIILFRTNLMHQTTRDVNVCGYRIPKGMAIIPQISAILHSEQVSY